VSHKVCHDVGEWVESNVSQQVERCVEQDCNWWCLCCNKWFCFLVWVVVTVVNWVVHAVCEIVLDIVDFVVSLVTGIIDVVVGIFTWNWARVWDGLVKIVSSFVGLVVDLFRIVTLGDLVGWIRDAANKWRLRSYVGGLIDGHDGYSVDDRQRIRDALGLDSGGFGLRLQFRALRGYVRSDDISRGEATPNLVLWNSDPNDQARVDLKILAGFSWTSFWQRGRPDLVGDSGSISEEDIDTYLAAPTAQSTKQFAIYCMTESVLDEKLSAAVVKAEALGLKLRFSKEDTQLTRASQVRVGPDQISIRTLLMSAPFSRALGATNPLQAEADLCAPISVGTFLFTDNAYTGYSAHLAQSTCLNGDPFPGDDLTGSVHRDRLPDFAFRYVPIHEIGHTFGLCHADGLDRIMYSAKEKSAWSWWLLPEYLWLSGEPSFTYGEAKSVWDYIIGSFSVNCLANRPF